MNVNPFSLIGDKIDKKDIFAEFKGVMGDDIPSLDFNDYTTNGWYESTGTNRAGSANVPHASDNGYLLVVSKSRTVYQYWYSTYQSLGTMVRARKNGTWGSWGTVALTSDLATYAKFEHKKVDNANDVTFQVPKVDRGIFLIVTRLGVLVISEKSDGTIESFVPLGTITYTDNGNNSVTVGTNAYFRGASLVQLC